MRVLFVLSGNQQSTTNEATILVKNAKNQGDSLIKSGVNIEYFFIRGKGILGYLKNIPKLYHKVKYGDYQVIHAHYSLTAILTSLVIYKKPVIASLMGSDVHMNKFSLFVTRFFCKYRWKKVIVKSVEMSKKVNTKNTFIIPNGVDITLFEPIDKSIARNQLNISLEKKVILFLADINRPEKNFILAKNAIKLLNIDNIVLMPVSNIPHAEVALYLNACDVLLLTSLWEGSVNIVKEAMACNVKVVSTDVGDVRENITGLKGCYITTFEAEDVARKIEFALNEKEGVNGRNRLISLGLDSKTQNEKLIELYEAYKNNSK